MLEQFLDPYVIHQIQFQNTKMAFTNNGYHYTLKPGSKTIS